jgi:hypothetical protein
MDDFVCYCPQCGGQVLFEAVKSPESGDVPTHLVADELYCPHCEMLVKPVIAPVDGLGDSDPAFRGDDPANPGRTSTGGSNAGGSQRGDLSDEGASQWRRDRQDAENNTWRDKV